GSRIAQVHNGSSLFTGDAGQGESNIRRWIIENDWLEAIIALPENMFYNTGIATYIWVLSNRKSALRQGQVQLIDASELCTALRKNLGSKNCELSAEHIAEITELFLECKESDISKIFPNQAFGYWKVSVDRPLRLAVDLSPARLERFERVCAKAKEESLVSLALRMAKTLGAGPYLDFNAFMQAVEADAAEHDIKLIAKRKKLLQTELCDTNETAAPVLKKIHKAGKVFPDPVHGLFEAKVNGKPCVVEYEPDTALRDSEQVPLLEEGGIEAFFRREVLLYTPDAWIDPTKTQVGYEISFTRHFYKPAPMRSLGEIRAELLELQQEGEGLLEEIVGHEA
ncbi:MAG: N-6 DNA methylase, partial [Lentisphaeria bacterium]|nr:N-6 DNA methylase [Lentisphaeria bacterium]